MKTTPPFHRRARLAAHGSLHLVALTAVLAALVVLLGAGPAQAARLDESTASIPRPLMEMPANLPTDQIIIRFAGASDPARLSAAAGDRLVDRLSAAAGVPLTIYRPMSGNAYVLKLAAPAPEAQVAAYSRSLAALPDVIYAEPDARMQLVGRPAQEAGPLSATSSPNDSRFAEQWHYRYTPGSAEGLNLEQAWDISTGAAGTVVAVIDTGIRPHADLAGRILPGYDFINDLPTSNDGDGRDADPSDPGDWTDFVGQCYGGSPALKSSWHGTHVAGTIAANSNNNSDVAGVNWAAGILPVRVLGTCGGWSSDIADGMRWASGLPVPGAPPNSHPADVLNLSLGGSGACSITYQTALDDIAAAGVVVVVAAGNSADDASGYRPGNCNHVITVAATDRTGDMSWYSNYGSTIEISAPGGDTSGNSANGILSTLNAGAKGPGADALAFYQGTSMATPHVAGLVSLILGYKPDLTPDQVLDVLQTTAREFPAGSSCDTSFCGAGIADAFAALSALDTLLDAPALIAPADGATLATDTPTLEWSAVDGAETYQVQVATNQGFGNLVLNESNLNTTSVTPASPLDNGTYWWRVRAAAGGEDGPWSDAWSFTVNVVECLTPGVPDLVAPVDGGTTKDGSPTFSWSPAANASMYEIRIGREADVSDALVVGLPTDPEYTTDPLAPDVYYWMVRGGNQIAGCDVMGDWSAVWSVTIEEPGSGTYRIVLPAVLRN